MPTYIENSIIDEKKSSMYLVSILSAPENDTIILGKI